MLGVLRVREEPVGHGGDRDVADVDLLLEDQLGEQPEGTGERRQLDREGARSLAAHGRENPIASRTASSVSRTTGRTRSRPFVKDLRHQPGLAGELEPPFADRPELLDQSVGEVRLAVDAPELAGAAVVARPVDDVGREPRVQREDRTDLRPPGVAEADLLRVGDERADLRADRVRVIGDPDRVVERLRHLAAVRAGNEREVRQERLRLDQHLAEEPVEPPDDLPGDLEMRDLVLPHRHELPSHDRDVDGLEHRVAEQPEVRDVTLRHVAQPLLVRGHALEPAEGRDHPEEERHLGHLGQVGLEVEGRSVRDRCRTPGDRGRSSRPATGAPRSGRSAS